MDGSNGLMQESMWDIEILSLRIDTRGWRTVHLTQRKRSNVEGFSVGQASRFDIRTLLLGMRMLHVLGLEHGPKISRRR